MPSIQPIDPAVPWDILDGRANTSSGTMDSFEPGGSVFVDPRLRALEDLHLEGRVLLAQLRALRCAGQYDEAEIGLALDRTRQNLRQVRLAILVLRNTPAPYSIRC